MTTETICLASDNCSEVHPAIIDAILQANRGNAPSYGADRWTLEAQDLICQSFKALPKVLILPNGTGTNILALQLSCRKHESVLCTDIAHIHYQETGAVESLVGCKLLTVPHREGKITPAEASKKLKKERAFGKHSTAPRVLSITQPSEIGTVYTLQELRALATFCKQEHLLLHMDGSRLYNAASFLNTSLSEIAQAACVDVLSLGGTKNGLMGVEALLIFNPALQEGADHLHKQNLGLMSKMRYLSAQYIPFFKQNLWQELATQANQKAQEIAEVIQATPYLALSYRVETNQIFFTAPSSWIPLIQQKILCYPWDREKNQMRLITSWNTSEEDINILQRILAEISSQQIF